MGRMVLGFNAQTSLFWTAVRMSLSTLGAIAQLDFC